MPYSEVMSMPPRALTDRLAALERHYHRRLHDNAVMLAKVGDVNWGQSYEGTPPKSDAKYSIVDKPFEQYLSDESRLAAGLRPIDVRTLARAQRRKNLLASFGLGEELN